MFPERLNYLPKSKNQKLSVLVAASLIFVTCSVQAVAPQFGLGRGQSRLGSHDGLGATATLPAACHLGFPRALLKSFVLPALCLSRSLISYGGRDRRLI